jgi:hypothetical protein
MLLNEKAQIFMQLIFEEKHEQTGKNRKITT